MIHVTCPGCGAAYNVPESELGGTIGCSMCGGRVPVVRQPPPPPPPVPGPAVDDGIPLAAPVSNWRRNLLLAGVAGLLLAGIAVGVVSLLPTGLADRELVQQAVALADEARERSEETLADANDLEALDDDTLVEMRKAMDKVVKQYKKAAEKLVALSDAHPKDRELAEITEAIRIRSQMAEEDRHQVAEALWPGPGPISNICERVSPSVVLIGTKTGHGSGFLIEHDGALYVATNRHVVERATEGMSIAFPVGGMSKPKERETVKVGPEAIRYIHRWQDVAIISMLEDVRKHNVHPLKLLPQDANFLRLEEVWAMGFPGAGRATFPTATTTEGTVSNIELDGQARPKAFQMSASINPGNSGGPVFNSRGRVVGISTWVRRRNQAGIALEGQNFAVHVQQLRSLLDEPRFSVGPEEIARLLDPNDQLPKDLKKIAAEYKEKGFEISAKQPLRSPKLLTLMPGMQVRKRMTVQKGKTYRLLALYPEVKTLHVAVHAKGEAIASVDASQNTIYRSVDFVPKSSGRHEVSVMNPVGQVSYAIVTLFEREGGAPATQPATQPTTRKADQPATKPATRPAKPKAEKPATKPATRPAKPKADPPASQPAKPKPDEPEGPTTQKT